MMPVNHAHRPFSFLMISMQVPLPFSLCGMTVKSVFESYTFQWGPVTTFRPHFFAKFISVLVLQSPGCCREWRTLLPSMYFNELESFSSSGRSSSLGAETSDATGNIKAKTYYTFLEIHACSQNIHSKIRKIFKFFEDKINMTTPFCYEISKYFKWIKSAPQFQFIMMQRYFLGRQK